MRNDSLEYLTSEHASLKPLRIYLFDGEIYECIPSTDRENFWLRNLKTGEKKRLETALTITRKDDIRDITDAYIREHPNYATERLNKARKALSQSEDYFEAQRLLEPLAEGGDPEAQYLMAYCYTKASNPNLFPPEVCEYLSGESCRPGPPEGPVFSRAELPHRFQRYRRSRAVRQMV